MIRTPVFGWAVVFALAALAGCRPSSDRSSPVDASTGSALRDSITREAFALETIAGTQWLLDRWSEAEPAPADVEVTLRLENGRFAGSAGCNNYFSQVTPGDTP